MRFIWNKILVDLLKVGQKVLGVNCDRRPVSNRTELMQSRPYKTTEYVTRGCRYVWYVCMV